MVSQSTKKSAKGCRIQLAHLRYHNPTTPRGLFVSRTFRPSYFAFVGKNGANYVIRGVTPHDSTGNEKFQNTVHQSLPAFYLGEFGSVFNTFVGMKGFHNKEDETAFIIDDANVRVGEGGRELIELSLLHAIKRYEEFVEVEGARSYECNAVLDPQRNWCVVSFLATMKNGAVFKSETSFESDGFHPCKIRDVFTSGSMGGKVVEKFVSELENSDEFIEISRLAPSG